MAKLYFKYGAMGSSKTAQALITKYNYEENDMRVWLISQFRQQTLLSTPMSQGIAVLLTPRSL